MGNLVKGLSVLGATGSIGRQTLEVIRSFPNRFRVIGLAGGSNLPLLAQQIKEFRPRLVYSQVPSIEQLFAETTGVCFELASMEEMASHPEVELVVVATAGKAGLAPTLAAIRAGKTVALANKEVLVMAGELVMAEAQKYDATILPVDSEHSAIWQCLTGEGGDYIAKIILTASGGAFRDYGLEQLKNVTAAEALKHPTWLMGKKVTVDSATLMNKGMEAIEARWLFNLPFDKIEIVLHRESIIHSMVEFADGSIKAQLSFPDMRFPIQYALTHPERWENSVLPKLDFAKISSLTFGTIDLERYPCLKLALQAGRAGGTFPAVLSAADEVAVSMFLEGRIGFLDISALVQAALDKHEGIDHPSLEEILSVDAWARAQVENSVGESLC